MSPDHDSKVDKDRIEVVVNGRDRGNDLSILSYDHEWEYAVFGGDGIPESLRYAYEPLSHTTFAHGSTSVFHYDIICFIFRRQEALTD